MALMYTGLVHPRSWKPTPRQGECNAAHRSGRQGPAATYISELLQTVVLSVEHTRVTCEHSPVHDTTPVLRTTDVVFPVPGPPHRYKLPPRPAAMARCTKPLISLIFSLRPSSVDGTELV